MGCVRDFDGYDDAMSAFPGGWTRWKAGPQAESPPHKAGNIFLITQYTSSPARAAAFLVDERSAVSVVSIDLSRIAAVEIVRL